MNELERLREERDALAAQVERFQALKLRRGAYQGMCNGNDVYAAPFYAVDEVEALQREAPETSLARHDARVAAEALQRMADEVKSMHPKASPVGIGAHISAYAKRLRRQAEESA